MTQLKRNILAALLGAIAFVVMLLIGVPILPSASFLKYEPSGMIILTATVLLGPAGGVLACLMKDLIFLLVGAGNLFGVTSDFLNTAMFALVAGTIIRRGPTLKNYLAGYLAGVLASTLLMIPVNLVVLQMEFGMAVETIMGMMLPAILPFNLLKGLCNALVFHLAGRPLIRAVGRQTAESAA